MLVKGGCSENVTPVATLTASSMMMSVLLRMYGPIAIERNKSADNPSAPGALTEDEGEQCLNIKGAEQATNTKSVDMSTKPPSHQTLWCLKILLSPKPVAVSAT